MFVTRQSCPFVTFGDVPESDPLILAGCGQNAAIGRKRNPVHLGPVPDRVQVPTASEFPNIYFATATA
jgi:hypothetical protein